MLRPCHQNHHSVLPRPSPTAIFSYKVNMSMSHLSFEQSDEADETAASTPFAPADIAGIVPTLIGRDQELQQLLQLLYTVIETNNSQLVTLVGMAGVGKSRLAHELHTMVGRLPETVQFYTVQVEPQPHLRPYGLIRTIVAQFFRLREQDQPARTQLRLEQGIRRLLGEQGVDKAQLIGYLLGFEIGPSPAVRALLHEPRQLRERAMYAMLQCVAALATRYPLVLLIDDLHHADESSLDVLEHIAREGRGIPLLLCCLARRRFYDRRPAWGQAIERSTRLQINPLDERDSRRLVGDILRKAGRLPVELRNLITNRAEGNPLYVEELIKMLIDDAVIVPGPEQWQVRSARLSRLRTPASLHDLLQARLLALKPNERELLERAAVIGRTFWSSAVLLLSGLDQATVGESGPIASQAIERTLHELVRKELIVQQPGSRFAGEHEYMFRHALQHEAAYARVPQQQRSIYHAHIANWLIDHSQEAPDQYAGLIAEHYASAHKNAEAAEWYERAARHASASFAIEEAIGFYRQAMSFVPDTIAHAEVRMRLYAGLGEMYHAVARLADAALSFNNMREIAEILDDKTVQARAWNDLARIYDSTVEHRIALEYAQRAVELAIEANDRTTHAQALVRWGWQLVRLDEAQAALQHGEQARAIFAELNDTFNMARAIAMIGVVHELLGNYSEAERYLQESLAIHRARGDWLEVSIDLNNLGVIANSVGDWAKAVALLEEDLQLVREIGNRVGEIYTLSNLCIARVGLGEYARAEEDIQLGIQICQASRIPVFADFYRSLAEVCLATGRIDEALIAAQRSVELAEKAENQRELGAAYRVLGMVISQLADPLGAPRCFNESVRLFIEAGAHNEQARTLREWARHEQRVGSIERSNELFAEAQEIFTALGLVLEMSR
jgi:tetratricopeptide (TPR) repeat protein